VVANLQGLDPGTHGFHIHEYGDCSAPDAESAGGHFNPTGVTHGAPTDTVRHFGDLGNIEGMPDGSGHYEWVDPVIELTGENSIVGRAVIVHANPDDLSSQPAGNAGDRLACGLIEVERRPEVSEAP
jgi:Cu-Zn family superoxide dismutase